jgi:hypothetical protein
MDITQSQLLRKWTFHSVGFNSKRKRNGIGKLGRKKLPLTIPKRNADFRAKPNGLCIFIRSLNLMDLALEQKKKKQNNKL